jgi:integrase
MPRPRKDGTPARAPNKRKLTDAFVTTVKPRERPLVIWDEKQRGLALAIHPGGAKTWKCVYSLHGRPRWYTIGGAHAIGLADARNRTRKLLARVADGDDPHADRMAERGKGTFAELASDYVERYAKRKNRSWRQADALVRKHILPRWGALKAASITRADARALMARIAAPVVANQTLAAASAIFSWAIRQEIVAANPCKLIDRNETRSRERVLSETELRQFWAAFDDAEPAVGAALKVVLLTGQRPGECARIRHEHVADGWWTMPGAPDDALGWPGTKNGQTHRVWLAEPVQTLLSRIDGEGFIFPRARSLDDDMRTAMRDICAKLGVDRATPHDLRRTFSSLVTALGFGRDAMNRVTNHKEGGIADVYDRHQYAAENRRIMETVARHVVGAGGNVVAGRFG